MSDIPEPPQPDAALRPVDRLSPTPLPYRWDVRGDVKISLSYGPLDATFTGAWREDRNLAGGWRPNPGADETVNAIYDISGRRLS